jgi:hypothetical protein
MMSILKSAIVILLLAFTTVAHAFWSSEPTSLKELSNGVATELKAKSQGIKLYLDKANVKDAVTGESSNLSAFLVNELESALSAAGFSFSDFMEQADQVVGASYQRDSEKLRVFIKYCPAKDSSACQSLSAALLLEKLPKDSFSESLDSRLKRLVQKASGSKNGLKVFINPVVERRRRYASEFSEYVTARARTLLVQSGQFEVLEEQPVTRSLSNTRGLAAKAKSVQNLETSAALFSGADAVLEGYYLEGTGRVTVALTLKNLKGSVLGSAEESFDRQQIPYSTANQTADSLAVIGDVSNQLGQQMVKLNTTKGDRYQVYRTGEKVQFLIQTAKPLYLYLYGFNSKNEVSQLYPGAGQQQKPLRPGLLHRVPGDRESWEIVVEPPYGTDLVKLFAAEHPLPVPTLSAGVAAKGGGGTDRLPVQQKLAVMTDINGLDLVDYFKGIAVKLGIVLYEDSLYVQTRPK